MAFWVHLLYFLPCFVAFLSGRKRETQRDGDEDVSDGGEDGGVVVAVVVLIMVVMMVAMVVGGVVMEATNVIWRLSMYQVLYWEPY